MAISAACFGLAIIMAFTLMHHTPQGSQAWVLTRDMNAGDIIQAQDVEQRTVPHGVFPDNALAQRSVIGDHIAVSLPRGSVLTTSLTTTNPAHDLLPGERLIAIHVDSGADLAQPGLFVDISGPLPSDEQGEYGLLAHHARVVSVNTSDTKESFTTQSGTKVTQITLAVSLSDASLIYGAASIGSLSIMVSAS